MADLPLRSTKKTSPKRGLLCQAVRLVSIAVMPVVPVAIANMDHSADLADRGAGGVHVYVRCASTYCLDNLVKVHEWGYALAIRTNDVGYCNRATDCARRGVRAGWHSRIGARSGTGCGLAQKYHHAACFPGQTEVDMRLGHLSI